jgi:integrase
MPPGPADRARAASELLTELQAGVTEAARLRRESIAWLREHGYSLAAIADIIGVSRARVAQLREAGPPPERVFLGTDRLTVAIPLKTEAASGPPATRKAGLEGLRIHDLRHTVVALWIAAGAGPKEVATRAGHTSVSFTLDRYGHLYPEADTALRDRLDALYVAGGQAEPGRVIELPRDARGPSAAPQRDERRR